MENNIDNNDVDKCDKKVPKKVRFNDNVVVHDVRRLYTKNTWICKGQVEKEKSKNAKQNTKSIN